MGAMEANPLGSVTSMSTSTQFKPILNESQVIGSSNLQLMDSIRQLQHKITEIKSQTVSPIQNYQIAPLPSIFKKPAQPTPLP